MATVHGVRELRQWPGAFPRGAAGPLPLHCPRHGHATRGAQPWEQGARLRLQHMEGVKEEGAASQPENLPGAGGF